MFRIPPPEHPREQMGVSLLVVGNLASGHGLRVEAAARFFDAVTG